MMAMDRPSKKNKFMSWINFCRSTNDGARACRKSDFAHFRQLWAQKKGLIAPGGFFLTMQIHTPVHGLPESEETEWGTNLVS